MVQAPRIYHQHKCVFIHICKTGGSSVVTALHKGVNAPPDHQLPHDIIERLPDIWREYFTFAFVRNPWDRFVSAFLYNTRRGKAKGSKAKGIEKILPRYNYNFNKFMSIHGNERILKSFQFRPQTTWLWSRNGKPLDYNFIGRYERLQEDFNFICEQIGLEETQLIHRNASPNRKHYTEYYNNKTKKIVENLYKTEIEYFNYRFGD